MTHSNTALGDLFPAARRRSRPVHIASVVRRNRTLCGISWTCPVAEWGVRVVGTRPPAEGRGIKVLKRNGNSTRVMIGRVLSVGNEGGRTIAICTIEREDRRADRFPGEEEGTSFPCRKCRAHCGAGDLGYCGRGR